MKNGAKDSKSIVGQIAILVITIVSVLICLAAPFFFMWVYMTWGGECLERGGQIKGDAFGTHCEGSR